MTEEVQTDTAPATADTAPVQDTTEQATTTQPSEFSVPDEYKDRGWASKVKSEADLYKQIDNLSSLVGKKEVIAPTNWEDEKSRNEFIQKNRPEKAEDYTLPEVFSTEEKQVYQNLLHENGVSKYQAEKIFSKLSEMRGKAFDATDMTESLKKSWGSDVEAKTKQAMDGLRTYANKEDLAVFDAMPNQVLAGIYRTVSNILDKHGVKETDIASAKASAPQQVDVGAKRSDLLKQIQTENSRPNPNWKELDRLKAELSNTYKG